MNRNILIITNNPMVEAKLAAYNQQFCDNYEQVLLTVRDKIHGGAKLVTHPLSGSVKPGETPYRSVAIDDIEDDLDMQSLSMIESAIDRLYTMTRHGCRQYSQTVMDDFQLIDYNLLLTGLESVMSSKSCKA
ncbi:hypothetical protein CI610_01673 [invertebrate metagenome]|uniref:GrdX protein n=1 Tax=invertebrate metagenome TaxID=1711999 RepID=A0A2H9T7Y6_9ZZZZ